MVINTKPDCRLSCYGAKLKNEDEWVNCNLDVTMFPTS